MGNGQIVRCELEQISWKEFTQILDSLQIASGYSSGLAKISELVKKIQKKGLLIEKGEVAIEIFSMETMQELINSYDSNLQIKDLL